MEPFDLPLETYNLETENVKGSVSIFPGFESSLGISHSVFIDSNQRGKGFGSKAHAYRLGVAKYLGFKYLLCTVRISNQNQIKILSKFGWEPIYTMATYCSKVVLFMKNLKDVEEIPHSSYQRMIRKQKEIDFLKP